MSAEAKFRTKCASCGEWIEKGDPIVKTGDDEWVHEDCEDDPRDLRFNMREESGE